jgi:hypothetical protein
MRKLLLFLALLWLSACRAEVIEDGDAFPTAPVASATAVSAATAPVTPTLAPTSTATEDVPEATVASPTATAVPPTAVVEASPIRIQLETGATTATLNDHLAAGESIEYLAGAAAGQCAYRNRLTE